MKKYVALLLAVLMLVATMTGCGAKKEEAPAAAPAAPAAPEAPKAEAEAEAEAPASEFTEKYTWSLATTYATGSPMVDAAYFMAEKMAEYSDGTITLNVFPDSTLYGEMDSFSAIQAGDLDFACFGPTPVLMWSPELCYLFAPYSYQTWEEYQIVYHSDAIQEALKLYEEQYNVRDVAGMAFRGWRNLSSDKPINTVEDLQGLKLRLPGNNTWIDIFNSMGCTSVSIPLGELYTSLQTGAANASDGPWEQMATNALYEVQDYIIETRHILETAGFWMSQEVYESLPENYKEVVDKAGAEAIAYMEAECAARDGAYLQQMLDGGCELLQPDVTPFFEAAQPALAKYFAEEWTGVTQEELIAMFNR